MSESWDTNHKSLTREEALRIVYEYSIYELVRIREGAKNRGDHLSFSVRLALNSILSGVFKND